MIFGVDLGTANTRIYQKGNGIIFNEPTAICKSSHQYLYFGEQASVVRERGHKDMVQLFPVKQGLVEDPDLAVSFLQFCFSSLDIRPSFKPDVFTALPIKATSVFKNMTRQVFREIGFRRVYLTNSIVSAARAMGSHPKLCRGYFIVEIGAGYTDIGLVSMGDIVCGDTLSMGGEAINQALQETIDKKIGIRIGWETAEFLKKHISCFRNSPSVPVRGIQEKSGLPIELAIPPLDILDAFSPFLSLLCKSIRGVLSRVPPELCEDIFRNGIILSGGGAHLKDLDKLLSRFFNLPVTFAEGWELQVIQGLGLCTEQARYSFLSHSFS